MSVSTQQNEPAPLPFSFVFCRKKPPPTFFSLECYYCFPALPQTMLSFLAAAPFLVWFSIELFNLAARTSARIQAQGGVHIFPPSVPLLPPHFLPVQRLFSSVSIFRRESHCVLPFPPSQLILFSYQITLSWLFSSGRCRWIADDTLIR